MNTTKGWHLLLTAALPPIVTIRDITATTNLSRWNVRNLIEANNIDPVPGHGPRGALSYELAAIITATASLPGKGNRRGKKLSTPEPTTERHALVVTDGELYAVHMTGEQATP